MFHPDVLLSIDEAAENFYKTQNKKDANVFMKRVSPVVRKFVNQKCAGSRWDSDELFSILLADTWRLLTVWVPKEDKKFHWLLLRQLKNKTINFIHCTEGIPRKVCPTCGVSQVKSKTNCEVCKSSLKLSDKVLEETIESSDTFNYLENFADRELVDKLLENLKDDPKTLTIIQLLLEGYSKGDISKQVRIAQNAINNRINKCKKIVNELCRIK